MNRSFKNGFEKQASFANTLGWVAGKAKYLKDSAINTTKSFVNNVRQKAKSNFNTGFSAGNRKSTGVTSVFNKTTEQEKQNLKKLNDKINNNAVRASKKPSSAPPKMDGQQYNKAKQTNPNGVKSYKQVQEEAASKKSGRKFLNLAVGAGAGGAAAVGAHHMINGMTDQPASR